MNLDSQVRTATFNWLEAQVAIHGDVLPRPLLAKGFQFNGSRIPLVSPQGIFKPRILDLPLTITTVPNGPYQDQYTSELLIYKYRGTDPNHTDNRGLRELFRLQIPLVYFFGIVPGKYLATWPVYIVGDSPEALSFTIAVDDAVSLAYSNSGTEVNEPPEARRRYVTSIVKRRVHQRTFRERVLKAYREQCALCRLRHSELLDAAHIVADSAPEGEPTVRNGIALCKLHHSAFDSNILGINPEYLIQIRPDVLEERDGPMLLHGLQELHGKHILLPSQKNYWPDPDLLELRYQMFKAA